MLKLTAQLEPVPASNDTAADGPPDVRNYAFSCANAPFATAAGRKAERGLPAGACIALATLTVDPGSRERTFQFAKPPEPPSDEVGAGDDDRPEPLDPAEHGVERTPPGALQTVRFRRRLRLMGITGTGGAFALRAIIVGESVLRVSARGELGRRGLFGWTRFLERAHEADLPPIEADGFTIGSVRLLGIRVPPLPAVYEIESVTIRVDSGNFQVGLQGFRPFVTLTEPLTRSTKFALPVKELNAYLARQTRTSGAVIVPEIAFFVRCDPLLRPGLTLKIEYVVEHALGTGESLTLKLREEAGTLINSDTFKVAVGASARTTAEARRPLPNGDSPRLTIAFAKPDAPENELAKLPFIAAGMDGARPPKQLAERLALGVAMTLLGHDPVAKDRECRLGPATAFGKEIASARSRLEKPTTDPLELDVKLTARGGPLTVCVDALPAKPETDRAGLGELRRQLEVAKEAIRARALELKAAFLARPVWEMNRLFVFLRYLNPRTTAGVLKRVGKIDPEDPFRSLRAARQRIVVSLVVVAVVGVTAVVGVAEVVGVEPVDKVADGPLWRRVKDLAANAMDAILGWNWTLAVLICANVAAVIALLFVLGRERWKGHREMIRAAVIALLGRERRKEHGEKIEAARTALQEEVSRQKELLRKIAAEKTRAALAISGTDTAANVSQEIAPADIESR